MAKRICIIVVLFFIAHYANAVSAAPTNLVSINNITKNAKNNYLVGHNDPYLVFNHSTAETGNSAQAYWYIPLQLTSKTKQENIEFEIFFDGKQTENRPAFSARKYIKFQINTKAWQAASGIQIPIPEGLYFKDKSLLRLDINNCTNCELKLSGTTRLGNKALSSYTIANVMQVRKGISNPKQGIINVPLKNWSLNHLDRAGNVTNADPFMISPLLDTSTANLAGIYFEVDFKGDENTASVFQLFYATETHEFIEAASIYAKVTPTLVPTAMLKDENLEKDINTLRDSKKHGVMRALRFFLPLDFLSNQNPGMEILERVRLDFSNKSSPWVLSKVQLIPESEKDQYLGYLPKQMVQAKLQKASSRQVVKNILTRLSRDPGFLITYFLLVLGLFYFLVRASLGISRAQK